MKIKSYFLLREIKIPEFNREELLTHLVSILKSGNKFFAFALHVQALQAVKFPDYRKAFSLPNITYVDGVSILALLKSRKLNSRISKYPTTDLGHDLIDAFQNDTQRTCRIALIGGPEQLAKQAIAVLEKKHKCHGVFFCSGFESDWTRQMEDLRKSSPDLVFVGMGCPTENIFCVINSSKLPDSLVVTCGGWFKFIVSAETRAPLLIQRLGLEWSWRLAQDPKRLLRRYSRGALNLTFLLFWRRREIKYCGDR